MQLTSGSLIALVGLVVTLMGGTITLVVTLLSRRISDLDTHLSKRLDDTNRRIDDVVALLREIVPGPPGMTSNAR